ncbi:hypothetical protein [Streptomyces europaeiscabiei]|uniref:Uncharacterized protein n=1 Tax=Streptomyces europaeiscabiei TaxID=146819 RepID=A0ABU4NNY9_9ACTN|nr:hypothetical protein [Streptomyces europaeiscabiei]MDX2530890.1 hypothetical protein [Streptomyces europaeiscabiei]MDX2775616.1 hypothetical protein [Streptomyces europaeiscabiei]MDX3547654.1 hypothetical protein [Streptomyces europaeiscabiei]MDX3557131.1 hypothetical protein [Streptomyces europaeiscabiei]MDX3666065.1 hypothetical protein [Streptomyces europaeiscabiei]
MPDEGGAIHQDNETIDLIASVSGGIVITAGQRGGSPQFEVVLGGIRGETDARTRRSEWCQALYCEG